jgi:hypothetical protein
MNRQEFLESVGESGFPKILDQSLKDTWIMYEKDAPEDRVTAVLGFLHLLKRSGLSNKSKLRTSPAAIYKEIKEHEFGNDSKSLADQIIRYRLFSVFALYKSKFRIASALRGDKCTFIFDLCFQPKHSRENLDSALTKLEGLIYKGELPVQLRESWRKLPLNSKASPKSKLPTVSSIVSSTSTIGFFPLSLKGPSTLFIKRAADNKIVLRIVTTVNVYTVPWFTVRQHEDFLRVLLSKAFIKLKG